MRTTPSSSDGVKRLRPPQLRSVAGSGRQERISAFPVALPLRPSRVNLYVVTNYNHRHMRRLCSAILSRPSSACDRKTWETSAPQVGAKALHAPGDASRLQSKQRPMMLRLEGSMADTQYTQYMVYDLVVLCIFEGRSETVHTGIIVHKDRTGGSSR